MKRIIMFFMFCAVCIVSNAQLQYYLAAGEELSASTTIKIVYVEGNRLTSDWMEASRISGYLSKDANYIVKHMRKRMSEMDDLVYSFDDGLSNSSYRVYKEPEYSYISGYFPQPGGGWQSSTRDKLIGYWSTAISMDKSVLIHWTQSLNSNEIKNKKYFNRISESKLKIDPYDFLR